MTVEAVYRKDLDQVTGDLRVRYAGLRVDPVLYPGVDAGDALVDAAERCRLVVVGARGRGAFATALLGAVSHDVLHRAGAPVIVVPDPSRAVPRPAGVQAVTASS